MRERVTIQRYTESRNASGELVRTWTDQRTCWARVQPVRGSEQMPEGALSNVRTFLVTIRYWASLTAKDRLYVVSGANAGETLNIRTISNRDERRKYWSIECESGVNSE